MFYIFQLRCEIAPLAFIRGIMLANRAINVIKVVYFNLLYIKTHIHIIIRQIIFNDNSTKIILITIKWIINDLFMQKNTNKKKKF